MRTINRFKFFEKKMPAEFLCNVCKKYHSHKKMKKQPKKKKNRSYILAEFSKCQMRKGLRTVLPDQRFLKIQAAISFFNVVIFTVQFLRLKTYLTTKPSAEN